MSPDSPGKPPRIGSWNSRRLQQSLQLQNKEPVLRVAVVYYSPDNSKALDEIVKGLARGIESQGHDVTVIDGKTEAEKSLTPFQYIALGTLSPSGFSKSVSKHLASYLRSAGQISGKRCYAFIGKRGMRKNRVLGSLMKTMESEGMFLKRSDILNNAAEAEAVGCRLHIDKKS